MNSELVVGQPVRWRRYFHFDRQVLSVLLQRGWNIIAGGVTVIGIPFWLTHVEQGFYFAFFSILALQVFFDLGINFVVVQMVAHESAFVSINARNQVNGDPATLARLGSLVTLLHRWYRVGSTLFFICLSALGLFFFRAERGLPFHHWAPVWIALVFFASLNLHLSPALAVLEGLGRIREVARLRLVQAVVGYGLLWLAMSLGAGLFAIPVVPCLAVLIGHWWLRRNRMVLASPLDAMATADVVRWRRDIFPLQWRIALSWLSGYFIFNAFTPLIFVHQGAVEAGRIGIALSIFSALSTLVMSWSNAAAPRMGSLIAAGNRTALRSLFFSVMRSSFAFALLSSCAVLGAFALLSWFGSPLVLRVASFSTLVCLALVTVVNSVIFAAAIYMRAHKEEPMLVPSVLGGILTATCAYYGSSVSTFFTMAVYAAMTTLGLPWTIHLLLPYLRRPGPHGGEVSREAHSASR